MRRLLMLLVCVLAVSACGGSSTTAPSSTPPPVTTQTRIMVLGGNLSFGAVTLNTVATGLLTIANQGNAPLTFTNIQAPCATQYRASNTSGTIPPGQSLNITIQYTPTTVGSCDGNITVTADQTSGNTSIPIRASGTLDGVPLFSRGGVGNTVFDIPTYITRLRITADFGGFSSNFIAHVNGRTIANELMGTGWSQTHYDAVVLTSGGVLDIVSSSGVSWLFTEVR